MYANEIATGRNWYTADSAKLVTFNDCARVELHWNDGGYAQDIFEGSEFESKARQYLREHGFNA